MAKNYLIKTLIFIFLIMLLLSFTSCFPVSLKKIDIQSISCELIRIDTGFKVEKIVPGNSYYAEIKIITKDGKKISNPNLKDLYINSQNNSITYSINIWNQLILSFKNDFLFAAYDDFKLTIGSKYDKLVENSFTWVIDWYNLPYLNFRGKDGIDGFNGTDGIDGADGTSSSPNGGNGTDGTNGGDGTDGENGKTISLNIAYYKVPRKIEGYFHDYFIIIYEEVSNQIYLFPIDYNIVVDTSGGNGGDAGAPGKGGKGGKGYNGAPNGLNGKDGQPGKPGKGGDAGNIYVKCPSGFPVFKYFKFIAEGGKHGEAYLDFSKLNLVEAIVSTLVNAIFSKMVDGKNGFIDIKEVPLDKLFLGVQNNYFEKDRIFDLIN
ncbi:MAG TPA: hypothetical protein PLF21_07245 [Exilispira sp.]|nr:hypothetical protein [Exilispira sp.]